MTLLEMIREWQKGCSCAGPSHDLMRGLPEGSTGPEACPGCTRALIDAIEKSLSSEQPADSKPRYMVSCLREPFTPFTVYRVYDSETGQYLCGSRSERNIENVVEALNRTNDEGRNTMNKQTPSVNVAVCASISAHDAGHVLKTLCHRAALEAGWWNDLQTGDSLIGKRNVGEMLCLIHSEISEAMEGHRKGLMDEHLPMFKSIEVELADAIIRIADLCGALDLDLGGAIAMKMAYNATRADHKPEARRAAGGKAY